MFDWWKKLCAQEVFIPKTNPAIIDKFKEFFNPAKIIRKIQENAKKSCNRNVFKFGPGPPTFLEYNIFSALFFRVW